MDTEALSTLSPNAIKELKNEQEMAQMNNVRMWKNAQQPTKKRTGGKTFNATVVDVYSGDSISVKEDNAKESMRVFLAHVKAPRVAN